MKQTNAGWIDIGSGVPEVKNKRVVRHIVLSGVNTICCVKKKGTDQVGENGGLL